MILWVILIAIFSHFVSDVFIKMTFSLFQICGRSPEKSHKDN